ncbi:MAG: DUF971 domain-containing protein [Hyphomicrobiales bacterium]|nr:MAG: DUF971 domain-containing protein [Hyphomicrobiales bacterium]
MQPVAINIEDEGRSLTLVIADGRIVRVGADVLWCHCPSALRRSRRMSGLDLAAPSGIRIARVTPIGNYALNIAFSDGHDRGVFPWILLADLAGRPTVADFLIADAAPCASRTVQNHAL